MIRQYQFSETYRYEFPSVSIVVSIAVPISQFHLIAQTQPISGEHKNHSFAPSETIILVYRSPTIIKPNL